MKHTFNLKKYFLLFGTMVLLITSCSTDEDNGPDSDEQFTATELQTILETDDAAGSVDTIVADLFAQGSSSAKIASKEANDCYSAVYTDTGFTATFNNCALNGTENINGTLTVTYAAEGESFSYAATFTDFYVGTIKLNGTRSYALIGDASQNAISFSVTSTMTVEMEDGSTISEEGTKTFGFAFGDSAENSVYTWDGEWTLEIDGDTYSVSVTDTLEGNLSCGYLTSGTMDINKNGLEVTVDFGDGSCDDIATIIYPNGATEDVSLKD